MLDNFRKPEIVVYDKTNSEIILPYIKNYKHIIIETRNTKSLFFNNLFFLFQYLLFLNFRNFKNSFIFFCLKKYNPKIIITYIDNDINFYKISNLLQIKTAFIQNGRRVKSLDVFGIIENYNISNYKVDFQFVFNKSMCKLYENYLQGNKIEIGAFKSNSIPINKYENKNILLISSYTHFTNSEDILGNHFDGSQIKYQEYYNSELIALTSLNKWLLKYNFCIDILPRLDNNAEEINYYFNFFNKSSAKILDRTLNSYDLVDKYDLILNFDSTLGYEALGRGKKVFFISTRSEYLNDDSFNFGWPIEFSESGPFWLSIFNENLFHELLNTIYSTKEEDWVEINKNYYQDLMFYDNNNNIFSNTIDKIINIKG